MTQDPAGIDNLGFGNFTISAFASVRCVEMQLQKLCPVKHYRYYFVLIFRRFMREDRPVSPIAMSGTSNISKRTQAGIESKF